MAEIADRIETPQTNPSSVAPEQFLPPDKRGQLRVRIENIRTSIELLKQQVSDLKKVIAETPPVPFGSSPSDPEFAGRRKYLDDTEATITRIGHEIVELEQLKTKYELALDDLEAKTHGAN